MRFRTEIQIRPSARAISHADHILLLGSCFSDEIGARLEADGFDVCRNPLGPLFNPLSMLTAVRRAVRRQLYTCADLTVGPRGYHCLDYATRYSGEDAQAVADAVNADLEKLSDAIGRCTAAIFTFGSAFVYHRADNGLPVGNCHKFRADFFERRRLDTAASSAAITEIFSLMPDTAHLIATVSPVRHLDDGLHGNNLSKATLMLALDEAVSSAASRRAEYFPSYEMLVDDLRDYRFYADDLKHPSRMAVDYIYEKFGECYFRNDTLQEALQCRRAYLTSQHRPIL